MRRLDPTDEPLDYIEEGEADLALDDDIEEEEEAADDLAEEEEEAPQTPPKVETSTRKTVHRGVLTSTKKASAVAKIKDEHPMTRRSSPSATSTPLKRLAPYTPLRSARSAAKPSKGKASSKQPPKNRGNDDGEDKVFNKWRASMSQFTSELVAKQKEGSTPAPQPLPQAECDEVDLWGKVVLKKLRRLPDDEQEDIRHKIDNLLHKALRKEPDLSKEY